MNSGSEAADQMVREGIQITEAAVKLSALGAKILRPSRWRWQGIIPRCGAVPG